MALPMCASGLFASAPSARSQSLVITTETITLDRTAEAQKGVRFVTGKLYNSAWLETVRSRLAGSSDSIMNTNDGSGAPLELRSFIDSIPAFAWSARPDGFPEFVNERLQDYSGLSPDQLYADWKSILHQDEVGCFEDWWRGLQNSEKPGQTELRIRRFDGEYRWFQISAAPVHDQQGNLVRWCGVNTDIDDRKRAEQKLQKNEEDLRTIIDAIRQSVVVLTPDGRTLYANRVALDVTGLTMGEVNDNSFLNRAFHPDDVDRIREERQEKLLAGVPFELEMRVLFRSGRDRWFLNQYNPFKDERGQILRWYVTGTDIDEQKRTEEQLRNENLVLREDIDRSSMFEEIVGSSTPVRQVLKQVEKVAPSDSTVLILGETGTGKELIARALHRRSKRASKAFVRVNCAAIPQSLIASELFGHEKGAFTGALQRRAGRFEAADGGTLFLDEIGDLPMDTQIALLRVLQEKEFERVGSNHPISVNVRLIAATNRDLPAAVAAGTFREDLFYRLNVVPIAIPPLRERAEDIPLLVEYFAGRFAKGVGKNIRHIAKQTLQQLKAYHWPGNIRELQNVVERAVILGETDTFEFDDGWLKRETADSPRLHEGLSVLEAREVETIEAALAETHGRISGPSGAAAKLGIPRQTLESKIRRLGINKYGQKRPNST
jgi:formate hydrogenlyase transcriptional activator